ncbi:MAG: hypothetical protein A3E98_03185 [Candidatus Doudnabacteria bacterium RIFCSPHIGHO2_12_FULL_48_11]|uniref:Uncharacterized protein n=1 Tax=Candidatus Doudnabacteria bacterium RIFCSPHIGHO2_01_FULL_46_24 TaxID=1817825 RepID=A0A1F5NWA7_9BACT|nr:MAG: hypothetical protein A2720_03315 [Candidatus Doudnabacteria bacterium RIFCSPHIGHO2_01_FULL_46_24]OGE96043.1 MAG: hypothetical protein A3E98_03185 [Candidatus Doudnabacteria bacterium RIFCSPHIGHO2_12_FULL_48_11]
MNRLRLIYSSIIGTQAALLFAVIVTIWAELAPPLKDWLKSLSGHHWTSKSYLTMLVYVVVFAYCYSVSGGVSGGKVKRAVYHLFWLGLVGSAVLVGFFIWHYLE